MDERLNKSVNDLSTLTRQRICKKLDIRCDVGGDFRTLAAYLNMESDDLDLIAQSSDCTHKILRWWGRRPDSTISKLRNFLLEMEREDCVKIIDESRETDNVATALERLDINAATYSGPGEPPPRLETLTYKELNPDRVDGRELSHRQIDVLLLTATDVEFLAAYKILTSPETADVSKLGPVFFGKIGENNVALLKTDENTLSTAGVLTTGVEAMEHLKPKVIFSIGTCFGMDRENVQLGDVLVGVRMALYSPTKIDKQGEVFSRGPIIECSARLWRLFQHGKLGWSGPNEQKVPSVHAGLVISGPEIIENLERREQLRAMYPEALGGEIQGEGLYSICERRKVPWLVCKGVADWADGGNYKRWQQFAAAASASFVEHVMLGSYVPGHG